MRAIMPKMWISDMGDPAGRPYEAMIETRQNTMQLAQSRFSKSLLSSQAKAQAARPSINGENAGPHNITLCDYIAWVQKMAFCKF